MTVSDTFSEWYDRLKSMMTEAVPGQQKGEELDSCVRQVMAQGHDRESAYAICNDTLKADLEKSQRDELLGTANEVSKYDPQVPLTFRNLIDYAGVDVKGEGALELPKSCRRCGTATRVKGSFMCPECDPMVNPKKDDVDLVGTGVQEAKADGEDETEKADQGPGSTRKVYLTPGNVEQAPADAEVKSDEWGLYYEADVDVDQKAVPDEAVPIGSRDEAPEGAEVIEGERGGLYYIPGGENGDGGDGEPPESVDLSKEVDATSLEDAGITQGSNHAGMRIAELEDGSEAFVEEGYKDWIAEKELAGVAVYEELDVPIPDHHFYEGSGEMAKEAVEGRTLYQAMQEGGVEDVDEESVIDAFAATVIAGDTDMHAGNMMIRDDGVAVPIDVEGSGGPTEDKSSWEGKIQDTLDRAGMDVDYDDIWERAQEMATDLDPDAIPEAGTDLGGIATGNIRDNIENVRP